MLLHHIKFFPRLYNFRSATRLSRKHPNIWSVIKLIQTEHARFEHILIQLDAGGACASKQSKKTKAFQAKLDTLHQRFHNQEINATQLLSGLSFLVGCKNNSYSFEFFISPVWSTR